MLWDVFRSPCLRLALLGAMTAGSLSNAHAGATGVPLHFRVDPAVCRQKNAASTPVNALITLAAPAPKYFLCIVRSQQPGVLSFSNMVFVKGQLQGTDLGAVHWARLYRDSTVKVCTFSADDPDVKLWFTVSLKVRSDPDAGP